MRSDRIDLRSFDLSARHLHAVLAVAEHRSFIAAAAQLRISQPALTRTIKHVETTLGVELFSRTTRQVSVTQAGKEFAALADRLLNDFALGVDSVRKQSRQPAGQIVVSSVLSLADALLPERLADFGRRYPGIQIHLREGIHREVIDDVVSGVADFAIAYTHDLADECLADDLGPERLHVVMPAKHALAARKQVSIAALSDVALVSFARESRTRQLIDAAAAATGTTLRYAMTVNRLPTLLALVRNGVGLAIVPASETQLKAERMLTSRPLSGVRLSNRLGVLRARGRRLTPAAAILLVLVRRWLRERRL